MYMVYAVDIDNTISNFIDVIKQTNMYAVKHEDCRHKLRKVIYFETLWI